VSLLYTSLEHFVILSLKSLSSQFWHLWLTKQIIFSTELSPSCEYSSCLERHEITEFLYPIHKTLPLVQTTSWINQIRINATSTFKAKFNIIPSSMTQDYHVMFSLNFLWTTVFPTQLIFLYRKTLMIFSKAFTVNTAMFPPPFNSSPQHRSVKRTQSLI